MTGFLIAGGLRRKNVYYCLKNIYIRKDNSMKIAVTYENGNIFQHFGHTETFKVYDVEDGKYSFFGDHWLEWKRTWRTGRTAGGRRN